MIRALQSLALYSWVVRLCIVVLIGGRAYVARAMSGREKRRGRPKKRCLRLGMNGNGLRWAQASASEVGATDLADGTRGDVDVGRNGAGRVELRGVDDLVEEEEALAPASSAPATTSVRRSSRIRDRFRLQRRARLVSDGKGMFVGVVRNVQQRHFCKGIYCRFSYKNIGEKGEVVGYCLWCDIDKMQKAMESKYTREIPVKKGL